MKDPNFVRTVVMLCEHHDEGSFGLILNKPIEARLAQVLPDDIDKEAFDIPLYYGGPCEANTLHFLHTIPDLPEALEISKGLFWGGNFEDLKDRIILNEVEEDMIRFFIGYSGWGADQLKDELKRSDWIVDGVQKIHTLFEDDPDVLWRETLRNKGGNYKMMANFPIDPRLN
ncbi:UNVERIFIED_CONTAM: hypothetical protein GTU68_019341 [Idotea baltica]|nr:hypothetical protein [Idotea baltica]